MVTASHNPAKYNGYKCYGPDGCQMTDHDASEVTAYIRKVDLFRGVKTVPFDEALADGRIVTIADALLESYMDCVLSPGECGRVRPGPAQRGVYPPQRHRQQARPGSAAAHRRAAGGRRTRAGAARREFSRPHHIPIRKSARPSNVRWSWPRPSVLTCCSPPIPIATGWALPYGTGRITPLMTGNEVGCLLLDYILACRSASGTLPHDPVVVKTIVTSDLAARIAEKYGCRMVEVLTGFKYIGEQIGLWKKPERKTATSSDSKRATAIWQAPMSGIKTRWSPLCSSVKWLRITRKKGQTLLDVLAALYKGTRLLPAFSGQRPVRGGGRHGCDGSADGLPAAEPAV